ncbi:unnamed protein product [Mytilus coruscus]|uniref:Uncharacterized protein n=1 Tax=Mytilus coruscus TaxID=42192 RepID=A0A6J8DJ21_MYTCO|nr:unnamed protein product [Mytilus coruscus]
MMKVIRFTAITMTAHVGCSKRIVEGHAKCQYIANFDDVVTNTKSSNDFIEIRETLNEVVEKIQRIRQDKKSNLKAMSKKENRSKTLQTLYLCLEKYTSVIITKKEQQQAQLLLPKALSVPVDNIQVELQHTIENESHVRGCCILTDDIMVFTYSALYKVTVVKQDGSVDFSLSVTAAYGVAYNDEVNTIAISSWWYGDGNQITIIDLTQRKLKKTFSPSGQTSGIAATNKTLLYYINNNAIKAMDLSNESTREISP